MPRPRKSLVYNNEHFSLAKGFGVKEFGEMLESFMVRESEDKKKERFSPSSLGYSGKCARNWFYKFNGAFFDYSSQSPAMIANMESGSAAGVRLAELFEKAGILIEAEKPVENTDPPIAGYIDAIIEWKGKRVVVENKTTKNATWQYRAFSNKVPGYQVLQLLIYMYLENIEHGILFTENKDDHRIFIYPIKMNDGNREYVEYVFDWMRKVKANADAGTLPNRAFDKTSFECKGCEFKEQCWSGFTKATKLREESDTEPGVVTLASLDIPK